MVDFPLIPKEKDVTSVPLGTHESEDWDEHKAVQTVKRAAMHYYKEIFDSAKAGSYEALSNVPTWVMAVKQPSPGILTSAVGGTALTVSFAGESVMHALKFNRVLGILEEFHQNRHNPELKRKAAKILEKRTHGEGLLFENIPEYDLRSYPAQEFKTIMDARRLFTNKSELKNRVLGLCAYLKDEPKAAALKTAFAPVHLVNAALDLTANVAAIPFIVAKNATTNILRPSYLRDIMNGLASMVNLPFHSKIFKNQPRHRVQQKSFFTDAQETSSEDGKIIQKSISEEDASELMKTRADLQKNIALQKYEATRFTAEGAFMGGHIMEVTHHFNPQSLQDFELTSDNIKFVTSAGSLLLAWEPFAHIGKSLKSLRDIGEGHRAMDIQQYEKLNRQLEIALKEQHDDDHDYHHLS